MNICAITKKFNLVIREVNTLCMDCKTWSQDKVSIHITINLKKRVISAFPLVIWVFLQIIVIPSQLITLHLLKTLILLESLTEMEILNYFRIP